MHARVEFGEGRDQGGLDQRRIEEVEGGAAHGRLLVDCHSSKCSEIGPRASAGT
ncbi:hypothetical protein D3C81_2196510 [compost metagenome]